jgi:hypothetical protein
LGIGIGLERCSIERKVRDGIPGDVLAEHLVPDCLVLIEDVLEVLLYNVGAAQHKLVWFLRGVGGLFASTWNHSHFKQGDFLGSGLIFGALLVCSEGFLLQLGLE